MNFTNFITIIYSLITASRASALTGNSAEADSNKKYDYKVQSPFRGLLSTKLGTNRTVWASKAGKTKNSF